MTFEEKKERVEGFRPIDDVFFEVLADDREVCQEILRTILEDKALIVEEVIVQRSLKNIYGRSVRLDALCILGDGAKCNIEVQRAHSDDHLKRARFNAASIVTKNTEPGERFENVPRVIIVYISERDFLGYGQTIYHIDKVIRENGEPIDDGLQEVFVNTCIDDGTEIADLMRCFMQQEVHNPRFPKLSSRVHYLKEQEGGVSAMCEIMEKYMEEAKAAGIKEGKEAGIKEGKAAGIKEGKEAGIKEGKAAGIKEGKAVGRAAGIKEEKRQAICRMIKKEFDKQTIMDLGYTELEYEEAKESMLASV